MSRCDPAALDVAKPSYRTMSESPLSCLPRLAKLTGRPGALLHLEGRDAPTCPSCGKRIRPSEKGRFIYYRLKDDPSPRLITRFALDRCLRKLMFVRPARW